MTEVISVKFKEGGRAYYFDPDGNTVNIGDSVIVGTQNGNEFGTVSEANHSYCKAASKNAAQGYRARF